MNLRDKMILRMKINVLALVDKQIIPLYLSVRSKVFTDQGAEAPPVLGVEPDTSGNVLCDDIPTDPLGATLAVLSENLSSTNWIMQSQGSEAFAEEYIVGSVSVQRSQVGFKHFTVLLVNQSSGQTHNMPLFQLFNTFKPVRSMLVHELH